MSGKVFLRFILAALMLVIAAPGFAQDKIEGNWQDQEKQARINIYKASNGKFYGKIVWLKEPETNGRPKTDQKNPKEDLRSKPLVGLVILKGFQKKGADSYEGGTIYDPQSGKTYSCKMTYEDDGKLSIRGYVGISMLGRTTTWTRAK